MKYLIALIGIAAALGGCARETEVILCRADTPCETPKGKLLIHAERSANHAFTLTLEGDAARGIKTAYIEGVNMNMGSFPLSIEPEDGTVNIRGIVPVCTLGDGMRWKILMKTELYQIEAELP